jgi:hypothetical protein
VPPPSRRHPGVSLFGVHQSRHCEGVAATRSNLLLARHAASALVPYASHFAAKAAHLARRHPDENRGPEGMNEETHFWQYGGRTQSLPGAQILLANHIERASVEQKKIQRGPLEISGDGHRVFPRHYVFDVSAKAVLAEKIDVYVSPVLF